ncbi:MAG: hypothetical protein HZA27_01820 [Candidatus Omnitrophica bacterium]|nr:hypothetical protein [Candidatus Omnitrophota bacterium]
MLTKDKIFRLRIIRWTFIGILIRFLVMPFTLDADIFWLNYLPYQLVNGGVFDPYAFAKANYADWVIPMNLPYHPPLSFYLTAFFEFISKSLVPSLGNWLVSYGEWFKLGGGNMLRHIVSLDTPQLFRIIFALKLPALVLDMACGFMLLSLVSDKKNKLTVYKLWMLNLPVLYAGYICGHIPDIYVLFFIVLAAFFYVKRKPELVLLSLSLGAATKIFPLILVLPAAIFLGRNLWEKTKLLLFGIVPLILIFIPSYLSSGAYALSSLLPSSIGTNAATTALKFMKWLFIASYTFILVQIYLGNKRDKPNFLLSDYFLLITLLFFAFQPVAIRYYIWVTPFLALRISKDKILGKFFLIQFFTLLLLRIEAQRHLLGTFTPLNPTFFSSLPILKSFIAPFISLNFIFKLSYRIFVLVTLFMVYRVYKYGSSAGDAACCHESI